MAATFNKCALAAAAGLIPALGIDAKLEKHAANFLESIDSEFKRLDDLTLASQFKEYCPVQGALLNDYRNKIIVCPSGVEGVLGIRFRELNLEKPFVALLAQTEPHLSQEDFVFLRDEAILKYEMFRPRWLRAFVSSAHPLWNGFFPAEYAGKALVAAPIKVVACQTEKPANRVLFQEIPERVRLALAQDTSFYGRYVDAYSHAHRAFPASKEWARIETEEDLAELVKDQTLYELYFNEKWAGIFGGSFQISHGLHGFYVSEILVAPDFRSKRVARTVQQLAAQTLISDGVSPDDWFYGTIGWSNSPALKTALSVGRKALGLEYWLPL